MNEQIYTIPVNEAFDRSMETPACGCPLCALYADLQENELELILGASMMEPDVRIQTNELGFCGDHFQMMLSRRNRLGLGLILESHLASVRKRLTESPFASLVGATGKKPLRNAKKLEESCYVCFRIQNNLYHMTETIVYLWENDAAFRKKTAAQPLFCLPHYRMMLSYAKEKMSQKNFSQFAKVVTDIENTYLDSLSDDVSLFCRKFDYRNTDEPWGNSKDSIERAVRFLSGDDTQAPQKKK